MYFRMMPASPLATLLGQKILLYSSNYGVVYDVSLAPSTRMFFFCAKENRLFDDVDVGNLKDFGRPLERAAGSRS
jgi:hypothetical protein